jgi:plastocyanin
MQRACSQNLQNRSGAAVVKSLSSKKIVATAFLLSSLSLIFSERCHALPQSKSKTHTIIIEGMKYHPDHLIVKSGDSVIWQNKDFLPHTVTAKDAFDSKEIKPNSSWKFESHKRGIYNYGCTLHPPMKGLLTVE